jgi:cell fate regulator YaaT (PSP1 superfamily)
MTTGYENKKKKEPQKPAEQYPFSVAVKFRGAGKPYSFGAYAPDYHKGDWVVVETEQGVEMAQVEADALNVEKYGLRMPTRPVVRKAAERDHRDYEYALEQEKEAFRICTDEISQLKLDMHLLSARYTLDRTKILFIYLADQRVDFRELLKKLGGRLHCRIELRQIGERDKAKMVGGVGMCGMELCCRRFKKHFDVITINMAKNQLLALNIDKLSGMCGKLKCCLKYEDEDYKEMTKGLPKMGSQVEYDGEIYRLTNMNVMSGEAKLENHETALFITLDDLRAKGIPRKGVVMKRKTDANGRPVHRQTIHMNHTGSESRGPKHVSMELDPLVSSSSKNAKKETRTFGRKKSASAKNTGSSNQKQNQKGRRSSQNRRRREDNTAPAKNVTVRTFGHKKKADGAK